MIKLIIRKGSTFLWTLRPETAAQKSARMRLERMQRRYLRTSSAQIRFHEECSEAP